jgi:hypothetical protein
MTCSIITYVKAAAAAKHRVRAAAEYFIVVVECNKLWEQQQNNEMICFSYLFSCVVVVQPTRPSGWGGVSRFIV